MTGIEENKDELVMKNNEEIEEWINRRMGVT